jgi:hypothetical protein
MRKLGEGGGGEGSVAGGNGPEKVEKSSAQFWRSPEGVFFISAALTVLCFLGHILFLLLTEPSRYSTLSKESAFAYSSIPLFIGMVFFVAAILTFRRIKVYSALHIIAIIFVIVFGSLTVHGLIGFVTHLLRTSYGL